MNDASAFSDCLFVILIFVSCTSIFNVSIFLAAARSLVSIIKFEHTSAYICAIPYTETSIPAAYMYFPAGPLIAELPITGLTATTLCFLLINSFRMPLIDSIGPILVRGLPGAITIRLES